MKTKEAIAYILKTFNISAYRFAHSIGASPQSASQWQRNTRMSKEYAELVKLHYDVEITDAV